MNFAFCVEDETDEAVACALLSKILGTDLSPPEIGTASITGITGDHGTTRWFWRSRLHARGDQGQHRETRHLG